MFCRQVFGNISGGFRGISRFLGISRDFAEIPEFRGSATARNIRSPVLKKCPCLINASFPFTMLNLCQCPSLINTPCLIDAPMTISPQIYQQITKRSSLKHLVQCQIQMTTQWPWMKTQTTKLRFETEIWISRQHRCINGSSGYSGYNLFINSHDIFTKNLLVLFSLLKPWK